MKVYKLYGSSNDSANAVAQIDIQRPGTIVAIVMSTSVASAADSIYNWEVSFSSAAQTTVNDTVGPVAQISTRIDTSIDTVDFANYAVSTAIPVHTGDRIYLHAVAGSAATSNLCSVYLHVVE